MFTFAHISDLHLELQQVKVRDLLNKRLTGYLSWHRKRKFLHRPETLAALMDMVGGFAPDHFCVTGDMVNLALPEEIATATKWLERLAPRDRISLVPGNHDAYVAAGAALAKTRWREWMDGGAGFPYIHRRGPCAFIGLDSGVPTAPLMASGRLGRGQLEKLAFLLRAAKKDGLLRIVMLHHPPQAGAEPWRKALRDAPAFRAVIASEGADAILHGHMHRQIYAQIDGPGGTKVPVYGAGSASYCRAPHAHIFKVDGAGGLQVRHCNLPQTKDE